MGANGRSCEVLILGAGPAGASAAIAARRAGASVTIVDSRTQVGGNAPFSSGLIAFADTPLQRKRGITDSPEAFVADMAAEVERQKSRFAPEFDLDFAYFFAEKTKDAYSFMVELGFEFGRFVPRPRQHTTPRMAAIRYPAQFTENFTAAFVAEGIELLLHTFVERLLVKRGRVCGAEVKCPDGKRELHADRGVVVALGGYQAGEELRAKYQPTQDPRAPYPGLSNIRGDGHVMIEAVGGSLVNMHMLPQLVRAPSRFIEEAIAVNGYGERFEDEAGPYDERLERLVAQPEGIGYYICDDVGSRQVAQIIAELPEPPKRFGTLNGVATAIGCDPEVLVKTVTRWNETVEGGLERDPDFGRVIFPEPRHGVSVPPFSVIPMVPGIAGSVGGARVTRNMVVVDEQSRRPIPGLYAAGDAMGLINPATGLGGVHLSSAVTLGLVAGTAAARGEC